MQPSMTSTRLSLPLLLMTTSPLCAMSDGPAGRAPVRFTDVSTSAGLGGFQQRPDTSDCLIFDGFRCEMELMSGGAAVADINGDGWSDVLLTRVDGRDGLFLNRGDGTFIDVAERAGLEAGLQSNGAVFGDIDNDGDPDLFVTVFGADGEDASDINVHHRLYVNDGRGRFSEESIARNVALLGPGPVNGWTATFGDYDRDGWIDLSVTQWADDDVLRGRLLRNRGAAAPGHFEDVTDLAGVSQEGVYAFATTFVDLDEDGWQDLAIAGDFGTSRLFWNNGDGTFTDGTLRSGVGTDENGMGSTFGDFDLDGDLDWFVTSIYDPLRTCETGDCAWLFSGNRLYRNEGGRRFSDATDFAGVRDGAWGWGAAFFDFDNDCDLDLVQTNGVRFNTPLVAPFVNDKTRMWINDGTGSMNEIAVRSGIDDSGSGKGLVTLDYDRDGDLDVLIVQNSGTPLLLRNDGGDRRSWIQVEVQGTITNADGLGARVRIWADVQSEPLVREIGVSEHFLGQGEPIAHFGLGADRTVDRIEVFFPVSGTTRVLRDVAAGQRITIVE